MKNLNLIDLHLYLAGALPWRHRLLLRGALCMDGELRARLREARQEAALFQEREQRALAGKLFPARAAKPAPRPSPVSRLGGRAPAWAMASLAMGVMLWPFLRGGTSGLTGDHAKGSLAAGDFTAKGDVSGLRLFVKGDSLRAVNDDVLTVSSRDTLQFMPLGKAEPYLAVYGWDAEQGLVRLFPSEGEVSRRVSVKEPPPGLVLAGGGENRLYCVTNSNTFSVDSTRAVLHGLGLAGGQGRALPKMPTGWKLQVFTVREGG